MTHSNFNSLAPRKFEWNFTYVSFKCILVSNGWGISCEIALIWMSLDFTDDQSTLVQVMAWCRQATSHYLSQCWPRSLSPYGVSRQEWLKHWKARTRWHSTGNIFKCISMKKSCIVIQTSMKFVPKDLIANQVSINSGDGLSSNRRQTITWINKKTRTPTGSDNCWEKYIVLSHIIKQHLSITVMKRDLLYSHHHDSWVDLVPVFCSQCKTWDALTDWAWHGECALR